MSLRDQLKKLNVGMSRKEVSLAPHNANWFKAFGVANATLRAQIPADLDLHHIGSTSIPTIYAKPILDILGIVPSIEAFDSHRPELEALGFVWKGEYGISNRRYCVLYDENEEVGLIHLHVFARADREVEKHLVFRDYLRSSPEASGRYEELKRKLAETHTDARTNYSEGKSELIAQLLNEAYDWKKLKIARHEIGHAVMALRYGQRIQKASLKEMNSPTGMDNYRASMKLEPVDPTIKFTGERAIQKIMISLSGYASEILFYGVANIGGDDLTVAAKTAEGMLQLEEFRNLVAGLPIPQPSVLDMIENPQIRAYIDRKLHECIETLDQVKPAIQLIAEKLFKKEELTGDEIFALFNSVGVVLIGDPQVRSMPVKENGEPIVDLIKNFPTLKFDLERNHVQKQSESISLARKRVGQMLVEAQGSLPKGYRLLIKECHRPMWVQKGFWDGYSAFLRKKFPEWSESQVYDECSKLNAPLDVAPHTTGGAVDLTLTDENGRLLDLGTEFNASPLETQMATYTEANNISPEAMRNRKVLSDAMIKAGFVNYPTEWWHWSYGDKYWAFMKKETFAIFESKEVDGLNEEKKR